jgi:hypothetical protein
MGFIDMTVSEIVFKRKVELDRMCRSIQSDRVSSAGTKPLEGSATFFASRALHVR